MSLDRANIMPGALGWLFALVVSAHIVAQTAPSVPQQFHILVKQSVPDGGSIEFRWSDDGRYVAIAPKYATRAAWQAVVYDTNFGAEIRRLYNTTDGQPSSSLNFGQNFAFAHHSPRMFILRADWSFQMGQSAILSCALEAQAPCETIFTGNFFDFALSQDDHIAIMRYDGPNTTLVYFNPQNPVTAKSYELHLPIANSVPHALSSVAFFPKNGEPEKIGFSLFTESASYDLQTKTLDESFISIVNLRACDGSAASHCKAEFQFHNLPFTLSSFDFGANGEPLLCGLKHRAELSQKDGYKPPLNTIYDPTAKRELSEKSFHGDTPPAFDLCLFKPDPNVIDPSFKHKPLTDMEGPIERLYSPRRNVMLFTHRTDTNALELYTQRLPLKGAKPPPILLATASVPVSAVAVYPNKFAFVTQGKTARFWNVVTGEVAVEPYGGVVNLSGDYANIRYDNHTGKPTLWIAHNGQSEAASITLPRPPAWLGISADGNTFAYKSDRDYLDPNIHLIGNTLPERAPPCQNFPDSRDASPTGRRDYVRQQAIFSPVAAAFFVFCEETGPDKKSITHLYRWELPSLKQSLDIVAGNNRNWIAPALDGKTLVFGGFSSARLVNLATGTVQDLDFRVQPKHINSYSDEIVGGDLLNDNKTLALAITQADRTGVIKLFDIFTGASQQFNATDSPIKSIATDHNNHIVLTSEDNLINIFDNSGKRLIRLAAVGSSDWLAFTDSGRFDGTPTALKAVAYQIAPNTPAVTASQLFNELYTPGLLSYAWNGSNLDLTPGISMTTYLELPGIRSILQTLKPYDDYGHAAICTSKTEFFAQIPSSVGRIHATGLRDPTCRYSMTLTDQSNPTALLNGLNQLKSWHYPTPWDGQKADARAKTLHIFRVAISHYTGDGMPILPSSVPSTARLRDLLAAHANSSSVKLWGKDNCGADLEDAAATRKNILTCFDTMIDNVETGDEVVLLFSGHGGTSLGGAAESELFYFFPADFNPATTTGIDAESYVITAPEIADRLRRLRAGRVAIILDACDSGTLMTPLEVAAGARVFVHEINNYFVGKAAADGERQGVLLLADAAVHQDASSGMNTNLFLDKLSDTLAAHPAGLWSTDLVKIMHEPIPVPAQFGGGFMNPSAYLVGADFPISAPQ